MDSSITPIHFALATLFGASVMAISAFYIHKRTVDQVIDRLIKIRRRTTTHDDGYLEDGIDGENDDDDDINYIVEEEDDDGFDGYVGNNSSISNNGYGISSSLPNVRLGSSEWIGSMEKLVSDNLPPLKMNHRQGGSCF